MYENQKDPIHKPDIKAIKIVWIIIAIPMLNGWFNHIKLNERVNDNINNIIISVNNLS